MGTREEMTDWYEILEVRPDAGQAEIRKAYLEKARQVHPDRHSVSEKDRDRSWRDANARAAEVNRAYEVLGDEELRRQYDATRRRDARPSDAEPAQPRRAQEERRATGKELRPDGTGGWAFFDELLERALRALDRSGPIWRDALFTREKGGCRSASDFVSHLIAFDSITPQTGAFGPCGRAERNLSSIPAA